MTTVLVIGIASVHALDIAVSGTIRDDDGKPVAHASVTTTVYRYSEYADQVYAESDTAGHFSLSARDVAIDRKQQSAQSRHASFTIKNNTLEFPPHLGNFTGKLEITTGHGKLIRSIPLDNVHSGAYSIPLPAMRAIGLYLLRLTINSRVYTGTLLCLGRWIYTPGTLHYAGTEKLSGTENNGTGDTLVVTKAEHIVSKIPLDSYTKDEMDITLSGGVLRSLFLADDTIIPGWKPGYSTADSSFTLWNASDIYSIINGGGEKYVQYGMLQTVDLFMTGPENVDGTPVELTPQSSFIIDFGNDQSAEAMFLNQRNQLFDADALTVEGYGDSTAFATVHLVGATVFSYKKQFYFELSFSGFPDAAEAVGTGKKFLDFFFSKIE